MPLAIAADEAPAEGPRIGLVLSGGGARGAAHVGVLQVLEKLHVPVHLIAGTSMGAVVGGLYASGLGADELVGVLSDLDWDGLFSDQSERSNISFRRKQEDRRFLSRFHLGFKDWRFQVASGLIQGQKLEFELGRLSLPVATVRSFDELSIPFRAVATDIETGQPVVLGRGILAEALRASMSIPGAFSPVEIDGHLLVDGGTAMNLPVRVVQEMGADVVIAVDIGTPLRGRSELKSAFAITGQVLTIQIQQNTKAQSALLKERDILLTPDLGDVGTAAFARVLEAAAAGTESALLASESLEALSLSDEEWARHTEERARPDRAPPMIDTIRIENDSGLRTDVIESRMHTQRGERLDLATLRRDIEVLHGIDIFDRVSFRLDRLTDGDIELVLGARQRRTGVNRLRFGINLETDFESDSIFNLRVSATRLPVNGLGAEWRTQLGIGQNPAIETEFWQPLDRQGRYFVAPEISYVVNNLNLFPIRESGSGDGKALAQYHSWRLRLGMGLGRQLGQWGEVRSGIRFDRSRARLLVGTAPTDLGDSVTLEEGEVFLRFSIDMLDNPRFPTRGTLAEIEGFLGFESLGSEQDFQGLTYNATQAFSRGKNTILLELQGGISFDDDRDIGTLYTLGGFLRLSGLKLNERVGNHFALFRLRAYRRIARLGLLSMQLPAYLGFSVESGNTWIERDDISGSTLLWGGSVYIALDTPFSPFYIAYGNTEGDRHAVYFFLGETF